MKKLHSFPLVPMIILTAVAVSTALVGCQPDDKDSSKTVYGESIPLGDGTVRTFLSVMEDRPYEFGVEFNAGWESLPTHENPMGGPDAYLPATNAAGFRRCSAL